MNNRSFIKLTICILAVAGVLFAMGERPTDKGAKASKKEAVMTPDTQFSKGFSAYQDAKQTKYGENAKKAAENFEIYLSKFPNDRNVVNALYLISDSYFMIDNKPKQEEYLNKYFEYLTTHNVTENYFYRNASFQKAEVLYRNGDAQGAEVLCEELISKNFKDENFIFNANKLLLNIYEANKDKQKLIKLYNYFIANKSKLDNKDLYYSYSYKLAVIYFNDKQYAKAKPIFVDIVMKKDIPSLKYFAESSKNYLEKINKLTATAKTKK